MNLKQKRNRLVPEGLKAMVRLTGLTSFGLMLFAFGVPMSDGWLATATLHVVRRGPRGINI